MRSIFIVLSFTAFVITATAQVAFIGSRFASLEVKENTNGIFFSTNSTAAPFYLVEQPIDLPSLIGKPRNSLDGLRKVIYISTSWQEFRREGQSQVAYDYILSVGGFAVFHDDALTLTQFRVYISNTDRTKSMILEIQSDSVSGIPDAHIVSRIKELREKHR